MGSSSLNKPVLVVGGDSMIGAALTTALRADGVAVHASTRHPDRAAADRPLIDLSRLDLSAIATQTYSHAFLCAAVARLNDCFNDPVGSAAVNVHAMAALARGLAATGAGLLFLSTNQVLDGDLPFPDENAAIRPSNIYGRQKAEAERALRDIARDHPLAPIAILRLSKVLPPRLPLFTGWADRLRQGLPVDAAMNMSLAPIPVRLVVEAMRRLAAGGHRGLFQLSSTTEIDYAAAARHLCLRLGADPVLVHPVDTLAAGFLKEAPPRHTIMDSARLTAATGLAPLSPHAALDEAFMEILA